ncbi:beta-ketoacyl-ACP synthase II [Nesterenkonia alkaliphila]|uniref:3-oxoacyl-[acyl-carrier-protein] synthase 2 n=1 Tax=Nesterenkonia alkaliphila TaxID=1463631 RepID=A0A7K1UM35_9MICC|nr:beta-ketoacyl-ACP synthase II [Nesterenkonia alkaliphila]MVT27486.1 beta-ketoacyl-ACP synthase II [Nesterenkonia alkaliphila]GFZ89324.1 3-oxoacyl-[acyl-carrier-protein] synthase 2 [Nesterenkonia alkaliphila]
MSQRLVITGLGATTPLGGDTASTWQAALAGTAGARTLEHDWVAQYDLPVTFAAEVAVEPAEVLSRPETRRMDRSTQLGMVAAREAWADAGLQDAALDAERVAVSFATGIGGVWTLLNSWDTLREKGPRRVLPMTVPMLMPNGAAGAISLEFGAKAGGRTAVSACASGVEALIMAMDLLRSGQADMVLAGGTEAAIHPLPLAAFANMQALSRRNEDPAAASRPYDVDRDGFVMGEGAGALIIETEEHAKARGATVYAELAGGAVTSDAHHITAPDPEGMGASRAVRKALASASAETTDVTHVNAHATSTPLGDVPEYVAMKSVFGSHLDNVCVSATKSQTGHLLGAAGAVESVFTVKALADRKAPVTINLENQDPEIPLDVVSGTPRELGEGDQVAICSSFGFGGHNAVAAFRTV